MSSRVLDALRPPKLSTALDSGHVVVVTHDQQVEVHNPEGDVQVRIALTDGQPVVTLSGARLELESPDTVAVKSRVFEVRASEKVDVRSEGEVELSSAGEMKLFADEDFSARAPCIWLN